jgi:hypothetical protein
MIAQIERLPRGLIKSLFFGEKEMGRSQSKTSVECSVSRPSLKFLEKNENIREAEKLHKGG